MPWVPIAKFSCVSKYKSISTSSLGSTSNIGGFIIFFKLSVSNSKTTIAKVSLALAPLKNVKFWSNCLSNLTAYTLSLSLWS